MGLPFPRGNSMREHGAGPQEQHVDPRPRRRTNPRIIPEFQVQQEQGGDYGNKVA